MANARVMVFLKLILDTLAAILTLVIFFVYAFQYMKNYRIFMTKLEVYDSTDGMDVSTIGAFGTICDHLCSSNLGPCHEVCKRENDFKTAGILFITFSCISLMFSVYSACNLLAMACGCSCFGIFKIKWFHFGIPLTQALGLVLYVSVSRVFSLPTSVYSNSYKMKAGPGLVLMFIVIALELISACYFIYALKNGIEDILLVTQAGYRAKSEALVKQPPEAVRNSIRGETGPNRRSAVYSQLLNSLVEMGFEPGAVDIALSYCGSRNIEEVMSFLLKENGVWRHPFLRKRYAAREEADVCIICREGPSEHAIVGETARPQSLPSRISPIRMYGDVRQSFSAICEICYERVDMPWIHPQCSEHNFCLPCVQSYVEQLISESKVEQITCPGKDCKAELTDKMVADLVDPNHYEKYLRFKERAELLKNGNIRWCPTPNCEGRMEGGDKKVHVTCSFCGFEMCFKCGGKWHGKRTCEFAMDHEFKAYIKEHEVQKCPKCKRPVEKADGCNHMTCAACHYEFCWLCGGAYLGGAHFNPLNPLGCAGLQGGYNEKRNWPMWKIYGLRILKLLLLLLIIALSPLALFLIGPCYVAISFNRRLWNTPCFSGTLRTMFIFVIALIVSIPCILLLLPMLLCYGLFFTLRGCYRICS